MSTISFYVPSTTNADKLISQSAFNDRITSIGKSFSKLFGGATAVDGLGFYLSHDNTLIRETVKIITAFTNNETAVQQYSAILAIAKDKCREWQQESILVNYNGNVLLVGEEDTFELT